MLLINPKRKDPAGHTFSPSPKKKKRTEEEDENDWELQCTQVDFNDDDDMMATQVDFIDNNEEKEDPPAFRLSAFGDEDVVTYVDDKEIACKWSLDPFCIGRIKFLQMPDEHKNRISRKHFEIHCSNNPDTDAKEFWLVDFSANGTMVDGEIGYAGKKTLLEDGSAIGILLTPTKDHVLFGYSFSIGDSHKITNNSNNKNKFKLPSKPTTINSKKTIETKAAKPASTATKQSAKREDDSNGAEKENEKKMNGVFVIPAPKARTTPTSTTKVTPTSTSTPSSTTKSTTKAKSGFLEGLRFALVGYDEAALSDPKKKKLIKNLCDQGASYVLNPEPTNVDVVVLNRNYFKDPSLYNINLPSLTSSLSIRFIGNTRYLEDCLASLQRLSLSHTYEILPSKSGGVVVLSNSPTTEKGASVRGIDPYLVSQLASLLREEKKRGGVRWKVVADLSTISACAGMLEGLEGAVEVLKETQKKGDKDKKDMDFMFGIREMHAAGYRHTLLLVNKKDKMNKGLQKIEKVVTVVDAAGFSTFAKNLNEQRNKAKKEKEEK